LQALPACIDRLQQREAPLLRAARGSQFDIAALEQAMRDAVDIY